MAAGKDVIVSNYGSSSAIYRRDKRDIATVSNIHPLQRRAQEELKAEGYSCTFIDLYALTLETMITVDSSGKYKYFKDAVHPNGAGYSVYAQVILDAIFNGVTEVENFKMTHIWVDQKGTNNTDCTRENPTSNLSIAFSKAADNATIHIVGTCNFKNGEYVYSGFSTPIGAEDLTIVGEGTNPMLLINSDQFFVKNDLTMDNIALVSTAGPTAYNPLHISLGLPWARDLKPELPREPYWSQVMLLTAMIAHASSIIHDSRSARIGMQQSKFSAAIISIPSMMRMVPAIQRILFTASTAVT